MKNDVTSAAALPMCVSALTHTLVSWSKTSTCPRGIAASGRSFADELRQTVGRIRQAENVSRTMAGAAAFRGRGKLRVTGVAEAPADADPGLRPETA